VLLLPTTSHAATAYAELLAAGSLTKLYLARVRGRLDTLSPQLVDAPITTTSDAGATWHECAPARSGDGPRTKWARTVLVSLSHDAASDTSLVLCQPGTGRPHQIRLHLQSIGHPIHNDPLYGAGGARADGRCSSGCGFSGGAGGESCSGADAARDSGGDVAIWLHAWRYSCNDPARPFFVEAPLPEWVAPFEPLAEVEDALAQLAVAAAEHALSGRCELRQADLVDEAASGRRRAKKPKTAAAKPDGGGPSVAAAEAVCTCVPGDKG